MNNLHLPRIPLQPCRQLLLTDLQLRTDLIEAVLSIQVLRQCLVVDEVFVLIVALHVNCGTGTRAGTAPGWDGS